MTIDPLADARARTDTDLAAGRPAPSLVEEIGLGLAGVNARSVPTTPQRVRLLTALAPRLSGTERTEALDRALASTLALDAEQTRVKILAGLVGHLDTAQVERALTAALAISDDYHRLGAIVALAPRLDRAQLDRVLPMVTAVNRSRAPVSKTMAGLAPYLAADQLDEALAVVLDDKLDRSRAAQVAAIAEHLDPARRAAVVEATLTMEARLRADILTRLLPHLDGAARDGALAHARAAAAETAPNRLLWMIRLCGQVPDPAWRAETLAMIAAEPNQRQRGESLVTLVQSLDGPHWDGPHLDEALDMVLALTDDNTRAFALTRIAAHLSGDALQRACDDLFALPAADRRASALVGLLRAWPEATSGGRSAAAVALADALTVNDARSRSTLLTEVAEFLDHDDLGRALAAADALPGNSGRGETLGEVARHLDDARLAQVFAAIVTLTPAPLRDRPLQILARRAPAGLLHEIVAAARDEWGRATLVAVARRAAELAGDSQAEAAGLTALRTALDGDDRGTALEILAELIGFVADTAGPDAMRRLWPHVTETLDRRP